MLVLLVFLFVILVVVLKGVVIIVFQKLEWIEMVIEVFGGILVENFCEFGFDVSFIFIVVLYIYIFCYLFEILNVF